MIIPANAPISYGAFELTVDTNPHVPEPAVLLSAVSEAGYAGIDLGPAGYLGRGATLRDRLESRGLGLTGGYLELPYSDGEALNAALPGLEELLDLFDDAPGGVLPPRPTLADAGNAVRRKHPARAQHDRNLGLSASGWRRFADGLTRAVERCRDRGYEPTLHCETGTYVEAEWEIDTALEMTDIGLCLETGHQVVGGGDPLRSIAKWGERINHVHIKDVKRSVLADIIEGHEDSDAIWRRRAFCALGHGDVPLDGVLDALQGIGYSGWVVVEQDLMPEATDDPTEIAADQVANREYLRARGL
jgi:inosose dehydratase